MADGADTNIGSRPLEGWRCCAVGAMPPAMSRIWRALLLGAGAGAEAAPRRHRVEAGPACWRLVLI